MRRYDENTGAAKGRYAYTPYGEVTILDPRFSAVSGNVSTISNELLYTGRRRDPETGLQLNRNRFYAAGLGRWVNRDPIGYEAQTYNLYGYVENRPINFIDPSGEISASDFFVIPCGSVSVSYNLNINSVKKTGGLCWGQIPDRNKQRRIEADINNQLGGGKPKSGAYDCQLAGGHCCNIKNFSKSLKIPITYNGSVKGCRFQVKATLFINIRGTVGVCQDCPCN